MSAARLYLGGLPTDIDVRKLKARFGVPQVGQELSHSELAECIGVDKTSTRYGSVMAAWRRALKREHNLVLGAVPGEGFRVLTDAERMSEDTRKGVIGARMIARAVKDSLLINTSDPELKARQQVLRQLGEEVVGSTNNALKRLGLPKPAAQNPKPFEPIK